MNRIAVLSALVAVIAVVGAMSASFTGTSLAVVTVLIASGLLVHRFAESFALAEAGEAAPRGVAAITAVFIRNVFRFAIGAMVLGWMVVSLLWFVAG
jgi:hypothetical protein